MVHISYTCQAVSVIIGGLLVHLTLGTLYTFGNLNPYLTSYMRHKHVSSDLTTTQCSWIYALSAVGQGSSMLLGGILERRIGPRWTTLIGSWFMSLGVFLTYFTCDLSFPGTVITYGLMFGLGIGVAYAVPLACAVKWMPHRKGLVNGLVVAGFGGGAFIFNQVQTAYINPDNYKTNGTYFNQPDLLERVPDTFLILGGCYAVMQFIGCMFLRDPPSHHEYDLEVSKGTDEEEDGVSCCFNDKSNLIKPGQPSKVRALEDEEEEEEEEGGHKQHSLIRMLKSPHFYILFFMFFLNGQGVTFISTLYKAYGQTFIYDDIFLAWVGAFASVFNGFGRIFWGFVADKTSVRVALLCMTACFTVFMLTLDTSEKGGKFLFFVYVCLLFGSSSGSFVLFPTAAAKIWGKKTFSMNCGLLFTSQIITAPLGVLVSQKLKTLIGWPGLFFAVSGCSFASFLLAMFFNAKEKNGKEV